MAEAEDFCLRMLIAHVDVIRKWCFATLPHQERKILIAAKYVIFSSFKMNFVKADSNDEDDYMSDIVLAKWFVSN